MNPIDELKQFLKGKNVPFTEEDKFVVIDNDYVGALKSHWEEFETMEWADKLQHHGRFDGREDETVHWSKKKTQWLISEKQFISL